MTVTLLANYEHALPALPAKARLPTAATSRLRSPAARCIHLSSTDVLQLYLTKADTFLRSELATSSTLANGFIPATESTLLGTGFSQIRPRIGHKYEVFDDATWATFTFKAGNNTGLQAVRLLKFVRAGSIEGAQEGQIQGLEIEHNEWNWGGMAGNCFIISDWQGTIFCWEDVDDFGRAKGAFVPKEAVRKVLLGYILVKCEEWDMAASKEYAA
ncbi:hypothetical protein EK21DRAFT_114915 [Setomelanomma holmii]|uniref:Uncharacterized protein n=1 Tax=Setomelanomma holmii TaxID=210430 RepID=A0A9P4LKR1_9PLEO|nr:hypothetical protein EK21DRAFT_114915 [Setomelanomma holmii]